MQLRAERVVPLTTAPKEDNAAKMLDQRQQSEVAAFLASQILQLGLQEFRLRPSIAVPVTDWIGDLQDVRSGAHESKLGACVWREIIIRVARSFG